MVSENIVEKINWDKVNQLLPVIIQDAVSQQVLMLGYMNKAALLTTIETGWVTFYSRTKKRLWMKGESSENKLKPLQMVLDCDQDTLLIEATATGPCCHRGVISCFSPELLPDHFSLERLQSAVIVKQSSRDESYTASLFAAGKQRMAQKVGEEGVEVALAAMSGDKFELINEMADLVFHSIVLLTDAKISWKEVISELERRASIK